MDIKSELLDVRPTREGLECAKRILAHVEADTPFHWKYTLAGKVAARLLPVNIRLCLDLKEIEELLSGYHDLPHYLAIVAATNHLKKEPLPTWRTPGNNIPLTAYESFAAEILLNHAKKYFGSKSAMSILVSMGMDTYLKPGDKHRLISDSLGI